jgi:hypothetical protein
LLVGKKNEVGNYVWVSDQTSYSTDSNPVYNSLQAGYVLNVVIKTVNKDLTPYVGKPLSDVQPEVTKMAVEACFGKLLALKYLTPSSDAPKGYRALSVELRTNATVVNAEIKLNGANYFIMTNLLVTPAEASA